ncbi:MAG TPA: SHOCT domain-containing protein [Urbifossiella sp.]|jgi:hypothetical protein|nr:SHOCT domain-containing protein [Urbifossiella sp.]
MLSSCLFAQGRPVGNPWDRPELLYGTLALAAALLVGGFVVYLVDRWRKRGDTPGDPGVGELTGFRGMLDRGEITEDEYNRLRQKVASRMKPRAAAAAPTSPVGGDGTPPPAAALRLPGPLPDDYFDDPNPPPPPPRPD